MELFLPVGKLKKILSKCYSSCLILFPIMYEGQIFLIFGILKLVFFTVRVLLESLSTKKKLRVSVLTPWNSCAQIFPVYCLQRLGEELAQLVALVSGDSVWERALAKGLQFHWLKCYNWQKESTMIEYSNQELRRNTMNLILMLRTLIRKNDERNGRIIKGWLILIKLLKYVPNTMSFDHFCTWYWNVFHIIHILIFLRR